MLEEALLHQELIETGATVRRIGLVQISCSSSAILHEGADVGAMVTGSHNRPGYNGFKITARAAISWRSDSVSGAWRTGFS